MIKIVSSFALVAATALTLTACGGGSSKSSALPAAASSRLSTIESDIAKAETGSPSAYPTSSTDPANVDVCALLSSADAISVAQADKLDPAETASSVYTLQATKEESAAEDSAACLFVITDTAGEGSVHAEVQKGSAIDLFNEGTKIPGLGDEAYSNTIGSGGIVVRVGGLMISTNNDTFSSQMTIDLLRKMAPNLK